MLGHGGKQEEEEAQWGDNPLEVCTSLRLKSQQLLTVCLEEQGVKKEEVEADMELSSVMLGLLVSVLLAVDLARCVWYAWAPLGEIFPVDRYVPVSYWLGCGE